MDVEGSNAELLFNWYEGSFRDDEKALEMAGGDGCVTIWMNLMPLNCLHLDMVKMVNFVLYKFYQDKKKHFLFQQLVDPTNVSVKILKII